VHQLHALADEIADALLAENNGLSGEFLAYMELVDLPTPRRILRNLLVATAPAHGNSDAVDTEIDMLVLHTSGAYVLEIKDYSGWIYGDSREKYWTQTRLDSRGGIVKYRRYNPLRQNFCHTQALRQALSMFGEVPLHPIVAFSDRCAFKKLRLGPADVVVHQSDLPATIARIAGANESRLSAADVEMLYEYLLPLASPSPRRRAEHLKAVEVKTGENRLG